MGRFAGLLGMITIVGLAYLFSTDRKSVRLKTVAWGSRSAAGSSKSPGTP